MYLVVGLRKLSDTAQTVKKVTDSIYVTYFLPQALTPNIEPVFAFNSGVIPENGCKE